LSLPFTMTLPGCVRGRTVWQGPFSATSATDPPFPPQPLAFSKIPPTLTTERPPSPCPKDRHHVHPHPFPCHRTLCPHLTWQAVQSRRLERSLAGPRRHDHLPPDHAEQAPPGMLSEGKPMLTPDPAPPNQRCRVAKLHRLHHSRLGASRTHTHRIIHSWRNDTVIDDSVDDQHLPTRPPGSGSRRWDGAAGATRVRVS